MTTPAQPLPAPRPSTGGNALTKKVGPLPAWGWIGLAVVGGGLVIWWRSRQSASAATAAANTAATAATDQTSTDVPGASQAVLQSEIQQLQGDESNELATPPITGTGDGTTPGGKTNNPPPVVGTVTVPVTYGNRASVALGKIRAAGLTASTNPARGSTATYVSVGSSPEGGSKVPRGSHVTLNVKKAP